MILIDYAQTVKNEQIDVVSESYPHLEAGVMEDFKNIMVAQKYWKDERWNSTKHTYAFETKSRIKFTSVDKIGKAHGPRRDVLFLNEANYLPYNVVDQLITRTRKIVWIDYNPTEDFWVHEYYIGRRKDVEFVGDGGEYPPLTFLDNEGLSNEERQEILAHKDNPAWWRVYGLGLKGEIQGKIYTGWRIIDEIPFEARLERYGLDFGYSNDPTAIIAIYYYNGGYILDEITYQKGLSNKQIADILSNLPEALTIADSAEPKSIDEIKLYGINIMPAKKGQGSVNQGIQAIQDLAISVTRRSPNVLKEYRNYVWFMNKDGVILNQPIDMWCDAMDAIRYGFGSLIPIKQRQSMVRHIPIIPSKAPSNPAM